MESKPEERFTDDSLTKDPSSSRPEEKPGVPSVRDAAGSCLDLFVSALRVDFSARTITADPPPIGAQPDHGRLRIEQDRLKIWAANTSAFAEGRSSLDYRLRELPQELGLVKSLLNIVSARLESYKSALLDANKPENQEKSIAEAVSGAGTSPPGSARQDALPMVDDAEAEVDKAPPTSSSPEAFNYIEALHSIHTSIDWLHRLCNMLRRASVINQNLRARMNNVPGFDGDTVKRLYAFLIDRDFPGLFEQLKNRMASTMVERHRRILYRRDRLDSGWKQQKTYEGKTEDNQPQPTTTASQSPPSHICSTPETEPSIQAKVSDNPATKATPSLEPTGPVTEPARSRYYAPSSVSTARSGALNKDAKLLIPPPRPECQTSGEFVCDYCCVILESKVGRNKVQWEKHIKQDLDAYVCLFNNCDHPHDIYSSRKEWLGHMRSEHLVRWTCTSTEHEDELEFLTQDELEEHMKGSHPNTFSEEMLPYMLEACRTTAEVVFESCPFCGEKPDAIEEHIGNDLRYLALKSIPWPEHAIDIDEDTKDIDYLAMADPAVERETVGQSLGSFQRGSFHLESQRGSIEPEYGGGSFFDLEEQRLAPRGEIDETLGDKRDRQLEWGFMKKIFAEHEEWKRLKKRLEIQSTGSAPEFSGRWDDAIDKPSQAEDPAKAASKPFSTDGTRLSASVEIGEEAYVGRLEYQDERIKCLHTLFFMEWNAREVRIARFQDGGSWLSSNRAYQQWKMDPDQHLLLIEGKPGSGKSTLVKHVARMIRDEQESATLENGTVIIAEFYYSFRGGSQESSHHSMLQSIVYQIWRQNSKLYPLIQHQYRRRSKEKMLWTSDDLMSALQSLHSINFDLVIFIILDAMDESDDDNRNDVLNFLQHVSSRESRCTIKLLVAGRPIIRLNLGIGNFSHIILQLENHTDILNVVNNWTTRFEEYVDPDFLSKLRDYIVTNSDGVFLWVVLVLRDLEEHLTRGTYTVHGLLSRLRSLPTGLKDFYRAMINLLVHDSGQDRDQEEKREDIHRILNWTAFSERPLSLLELREVLTVPPMSKAIDLLSFSLKRYRRIGLDLLSLCGGLVEVRQTSSGQFVQFIHPTVREFLLDRNPPHPAEPFDLDEAPGEFEIAYTCCRYLRITFEAPIALTEADSEFSQVEKVLDHLSDCPLLQYAITCFEYHSRLSAPVGDFTRLKSELESFITALGKGRSYSLLILSKWIRSLNWTLPTHIDEASATAFLGYMLGELAGAGRYQFVDILVTLRAHVDSRDASGRTPLLRAALRGYSDVVELLLSRGADVNAQGGEYGNALQAASWAGHLNVVELLLSTGADVNAQGGEYGNALQAALASGNEKIVELLLSKGADVNAPGGRGGTALYAASDGGHEKVVELLLGAGADVNAQGGRDGTALQAASVGGHEKVVELLLGKGAVL